jgi:hypothetical protein
VAIKQRCLFCNDPLHWTKRSDAIYCSPRCRKAANYASGLNPEIVHRVLITSPRLDYYPIEMDVWGITWSSATQCELCRRFITAGFALLYYRGDLAWFGCDWPCLGTLTEDHQRRADS